MGSGKATSLFLETEEGKETLGWNESARRFDFRPARRARLPLLAPAVAEPAGTADAPEVGEVQNLSRDGMLLWLGKAMAPGAPVRVSRSRPLGPPLLLAGTVVRIQPHAGLPGWALGIRFDEALPEEMVAEIADGNQPPWSAPSGYPDHR